MKLAATEELRTYQGFLSDLIQKQVTILGPSVALSQARKVSGFDVSDNGEVNHIFGNPPQVLSQVINQYMDLSEAITTKTLAILTSKYPSIKI